MSAVKQQTETQVKETALQMYASLNLLCSSM